MTRKPNRSVQIQFVRGLNENEAVCSLPVTRANRVIFAIVKRFIYACISCTVCSLNRFELTLNGAGSELINVNGPPLTHLAARNGGD